MTDKEKLQSILNRYDGSFEEFLFFYMNENFKDFSASRIHNLIQTLNEDYLDEKIGQLEHIKYVAAERALYLKTYLEGNMYTTKETAIKHIPVQIENAQAIINACKNKED